MSAEQEIRALVEEWAQALRDKNAEGIMAHHAPGLVQFSLAPPLQIKGDDADGLKAWLSTWQGPIGYELRELTITASDEVAFCHALARMRGTKTDGEKPDLWFRHTLCLRKIDGAWKVAHVHDSVPFRMDGSLKAAVDLQP